MRVVGQSLLFRCKVCEKSKSSDTICRDSPGINGSRAVKELAEVIPIEVPAILEFSDQMCGVESIARLPELEHDKASDECLIERPCGERAEIVDIARFIPLITCADFLAKDFGQRNADDFRRNKRQEQIGRAHV